MADSGRNHQVVNPQPLLDENGNIGEAGWATNQIWEYSREQIKAPWYRIKEWDYYMVVGKNFAISLTISDVAYMGLQSVSFFWLGKNPWQVTKGTVNPLPRGKMGLTPHSEDGVISYKDVITSLKFTKEGNKRRLQCNFPGFYRGRKLYCDITLDQPPMDTMVIATPWEEDKHFYYNQKINCMNASGYVQLGKHRFEFNPETDYATMDWGRGVWTRDNTWLWSSGNCNMDGHAFGFNLGYGFGDTSAATENILFYDGKASKLDDVEFNIPEDSYLKPWTFTSSDNRFEMDFIPILDRAGKFDIRFAGTDQHQVFGRMTGKAVLDDGTVLDVKDMLCFAEKIRMNY